MERFKISKKETQHAVLKLKGNRNIPILTKKGTFFFFFFFLDIRVHFRNSLPLEESKFFERETKKIERFFRKRNGKKKKGKKKIETIHRATR